MVTVLLRFLEKKIFCKAVNICCYLQHPSIRLESNDLVCLLMRQKLLLPRAFIKLCSLDSQSISGLKTCIFPLTQKLFVNFDPQILELIQEAKCMRRLSLEVLNNQFSCNILIYPCEFGLLLSCTLQDSVLNLLLVIVLNISFPDPRGSSSNVPKRRTIQNMQ